MKRYRLGEIATQLTHGGTPSTENAAHWVGDIPWITGADILNQKVGEIRRHINEKAAKTTSTNIVSKGDLLLVTRTGVGKMAVAPFDVAISQDFTGLTFDNRVADTNYLYFLLQAKTSELLVFNQGTSINGITRADLLNLEVDLPPKAEQTTIANILATVDHAIAQTETLLAKQRRIKAGLLHDLLTRGIDAQGKLRDPATHRFKASPVGLVPEEWEVVKMKDVCTKIGVGIATSTTKHFVERDGVPLIRNQNIREDGIITDDLLMISQPFSELNRNRRLQENDILTVRTGYPGLSSVVTKREEGWQTFTTLISRPDADIIDPHFVVLFMNSWLGHRQVNNLQAGGAQQNLNASQFSEIEIGLPDKSEQIQVVNIVSWFSQSIRNQRQMHDILYRLKTGLMQDLLSGRVSVAGLAALKE